MNEATVKLIEELAAKLGTTAEHLWGILIKQAPISSLCDVLAFGVWGVGLYFAAKFINKKVSSNDWDEGAWVVFGSVVVAYFLIIGLFLSEILSGFINPEYWALKNILSAVNP